jgi:replicative DNA helicase
MEAKVDMQKLKTGSLSRTDWDQLYSAIDNLSVANIYIDDTPGVSVLEIKNKCRRLKAEKGLDLIIIDYLQLMSIEGRVESRQQEISTLSRYLKQLAREMDCPVIVLSQLSRAPEQRTDHRPVLSDLRESGSIEQDADIILFLYRNAGEEEQQHQEVLHTTLSIAKHRNGPTGEMDLMFQQNITTFRSAEQDDEEE